MLFIYVEIVHIYFLKTNLISSIKVRKGLKRQHSDQLYCIWKFSFVTHSLGRRVSWPKTETLFAMSADPVFTP